ncbi:hypothetical protein CLAFUW4_08283 [Fulvia fulva]|nr:uncharacterized protein CLAFUR5_20258 [Fulvia fulva]KAK4628704.1 hypothetical protein CLAFUR4_08288 [Fulvia fulva]KAK4630439.1 hypothetical protein CLAFUR0_08283 [Fulvia fulva]WMI38834.1 hypothetical protein CLAFUR5_20258 [Fulvia fulva]WPV12493.1 hypothetical protein CLAFUW4_08283 [Fulvia fulva]WPV27283.1 hypothetical protein CLAFUW7_08283 [Fulvia fulva]
MELNSRDQDISVAEDARNLTKKHSYTGGAGAPPCPVSQWRKK